MEKNFDNIMSLKDFTVHDIDVVCEKRGEKYKYSIGFVADKKLKPEQVKQALEVLMNMVKNKL